MTNKLMVIIPNVMPTTEIALRTIKHIFPADNLKVVTQNNIHLEEVLSGTYKLLFMRLHEPFLQPLLKLLIQHQIPYLYYIDDNFWEIPGTTPIAKCYNNEIAKNTYNQFVKNAFYVITPAEYLSKYIQKYNDNTMHIDAAFDFEIINQVKQQEKSEKIKILYAGTPYRDSDFKQVASALKRIIHEYENKVEIHFHGFIPNELKNVGNIYSDKHFYPYEDHIKKMFRENYDIGIAPISDTIFNRSKSCLKFREYSACKIAGIYTNIPPYAEYVTNNETGLLVENTESDWYNALKRMIDDKTLRSNIINNSYQVIAKYHTNDTIIPLWKDILNLLPLSNKQISISTHKKIKLKIESMIYNICYKIQRTKDYIQHDGIFFTFKKIYSALTS